MDAPAPARTRRLPRAGALLLLVAGLALAGCIGDGGEGAGDGAGPDGNGGDGGDGDGDDGERFFPFASQESRHEGYPDVVLRLNASRSPTTYRIEAQAANEGTRTYQVEEQCGTPWGESMLDPQDRPAAHREPRVQCHAFILHDFAPGDVLDYSTEWNGTLWDEESQSYVPGPSGYYEWTLTFRFFDGEAAVDIPVTLPVVR